MFSSVGYCLFFLFRRDCVTNSLLILAILIVYYIINGLKSAFKGNLLVYERISTFRLNKGYTTRFFFKTVIRMQTFDIDYALDVIIVVRCKSVANNSFINLSLL